MNAEEMIRRIEELTRTLEVKDKYIRQLERQLDALRPKRERPSTRLERLLDKENKK
jgi:hypothetical protein